MPIFSEFLLHHWMLASLCGMSTFLILFKDDEYNTGGLEANKVIRAISDGAHLIDIRPPHKNQKLIKGSKRAKYVEDKIILPKSIKKDTAVILYCDDSKRSMKLIKGLSKEGYKSVSFLTGGIKSWISNDFPTEIQPKG